MLKSLVILSIGLGAQAGYAQQAIELICKQQAKDQAVLIYSTCMEAQLQQQRVELEKVKAEYKAELEATKKKYEERLQKVKKGETSAAAPATSKKSSKKKKNVKAEAPATRLPVKMEEMQATILPAQGEAVAVEAAVVTTETTTVNEAPVPSQTESDFEVVDLPVPQE